MLSASGLTIGACGSSRPEQPLHGPGTSIYTPGVPSLTVETAVVYSGRGPELGVSVRVDRSSLVLVRDGGTRRARLRVTLEVVRGGVPIESKSTVDTLRTLDGPPLVVVSHIPVIPDERVDVVVVAEDEESGRLARQTQRVHVQALPEEPSLGAIRIQRRDSVGEGTWVPALTLNAADSTQEALVELVRPPDSVEVSAYVLRLPADAEAAAPPNDFTPTRSTLAARGVDLSGEVTDTLGINRQVVATPDTVLTTRIPLPRLRPGVYRLSVLARAPGERTAYAQRDRFLVVRRSDYPRLTQLSHLIEALPYIAQEDEMEVLLRAPIPSVQRRRFDRFWGGLFSEREVAQATLRAYYERVEEANRLFEEVTPGWQTDRGMIYILFGPPSFVERAFNEERWSYGQGSTFVFEQTADATRGDAPLDVYVLQRNSAYRAVWRRAVQSWREGEPLR